MNLHPIFVHFPIALLSVYSIFELLRFRKLLAQHYWFYIKAVLVITGAFAAALAVLSGDMAKHGLRQGTFNSPLSDPFKTMGMHENFAHLTALIFLFIAGLYALAWLNELGFQKFLPESLTGIWNFLIKIQQYLFGSWFVAIIAVFGLVTLLITGALGGSLVYGANSDPMIHLVQQFLVQ